MPRHDPVPPITRSPRYRSKSASLHRPAPCRKWHPLPGAADHRGDRCMLQDRNARQPGYGTVAKSLHWLIVVLLIAQFSVAWTMPDIGRGTKPEDLIAVHLSLGAFILL